MRLTVVKLWLQSDCAVAAYTMSDPRGLGSPAFRFDTALPILIMLNTTLKPSR
jgi:hypothetical protein